MTPQRSPRRVSPRTRRMSTVGIGLGVVALVVGAITVAANADAPDPHDPLTATVVVNPDGTSTLTVSGTWEWSTHHSDCNVDRYAVGWAVDWNDPEQPGSVVGTLAGKPVDVGVAAGNTRNAADNVVHHYAGPVPPRCGVYGAHGAASYNTGTWGSLSHTYAAGTPVPGVCVVTYDIHLDGKPKKAAKGKGHGPGPGDDGVAVPKATDLVAGGAKHNKDNSVESNASTPRGNQCVLTGPDATTTTTGAIG